jgi:hypothetical protein
LAGIVTTRELVAAGFSPARIRTLVGRGRLVPVWRGVYASGAAVAALVGQPGGEHVLHVAAAVALTGREAAGSHHSAALIQGLDLLDRVPPGITCVTRPPDAPGSRTARPGIRLHTAALPVTHVVALANGGLRVTSVARTVVDLARTSSLRAGVVTADSALHARQTSVPELRAALAACARWPGVDRARQVVDFSDGRSESVLESLARVAFAEHGLPPPDLQVWVGAEGEVVGRADFLWRRYRTVGEADGALKYGDPASARARFWRDAKLREAGFEVVHFGWDEIVRVPHQVAASIRAAFQRGAHRAAAG